MPNFHHPRGNPREVYAHFIPDLLPPERFDAWDEFAHCLCGCGTQTKQIADGRYGAYKHARSFWSHGHFQTWRSKNGVKFKHRPRTREGQLSIINARRKAIRENFVDPRMIRALVKDYLREHDMSFTHFAKQHGLPVEHTRNIINGKGPSRIHPLTAVRLYEAIGEQPHPDLVQRAANTQRRKDAREGHSSSEDPAARDAA